MNLFYILDDANNAVKCDGTLIWGRWFEDATRSGRRIVARTTLENGRWVSTVFLGIDHGFGGIIQLFETMVFAEKSTRSTDLDCERCETWKEALLQHEAMVKKHGGEVEK